MFFLKNVIAWFSIVFALMAGYWASLDVIYQAMIVFIVFDIISGAIYGFVSKTLSANRAYNGVLKKVGELMLVAVAAYVQRIVPAISTVPLPQILAGFYAYVEVLSVVTNLAAVGVPVPQMLKDALEQINPEKKSFAKPSG